MARLDVVFSDAASDDLERLFIYITGASGYFRAAKAFTDRIVKQCQRLGDFPDRGKNRPELGANLQSLPFESVMIIYTVAADHVFIVRIVDGRQDYESILGNEN